MCKVVFVKVKTSPKKKRKEMYLSLQNLQKVVGLFLAGDGKKSFSLVFFSSFSIFFFLFQFMLFSCRQCNFLTIYDLSCVIIKRKGRQTGIAPSCKEMISNLYLTVL